MSPTASSTVPAGRRRVQFGLTITNSPLLKIRGEFDYWRYVLNVPEFRLQFEEGLEPIRCRQMTWAGSPCDFLTLVVQRAVIGMEAYVCGAVREELERRGRLRRGDMVWLRNPSVLGCHGSADCYFNVVPSRLDVRLRLRRHDHALWKRTAAFYREVRDPLFHGALVTDGGYSGVVGSLGFMESLYGWIDGWHAAGTLAPETAGQALE